MDIICTSKLNKLGVTHKVDIRWIPGHEGVEGNVRADELAKKGSSALPIGLEPFLPVPLPGNFIVLEVRTHLFNEHLKAYNYRRANLSIIVTGRKHNSSTFFLY